MTAAIAMMLASCATTPAAGPQDQFWARLMAHCGMAYAGRLTSNESADADMAGRPMVMHVRECSEREIRIPFHVGPATSGGDWDRSRTWVLTRTDTGLRLKHDHRHADGSEDAVTQYGGDTVSGGTADRQAFVVDGESISMFRQQGLDRSVTNVWEMEISDTGSSSPRFAYVLRRSGEHARFFRVEFDLTGRVPVPPPPWGS